MENTKTKLENSTITKVEIKQLPLLKFEGPIHLIESEKDVANTVDHLKKEAVLGFDTETKPSFKRGVIHPPALVQFATKTETWIFRLNGKRMHKGLVKLFQDPHTVKVGVACTTTLNTCKG